MNLEQLHTLFLQHPLVTTDTRKIEKDSIFFALKGPNFNGNAFATEALQKGAAFAVIDEEAFLNGERTILVDDVLATLQELGTFHRNYCKATVISLTGSNGKTTTKELIHSVLSKKYKTIATQGNLNNHIGVPLTLLTIQESTEMAIVEMGANHQKEIEELSNISQPDFGYITNFGKAHLEGFGGVEGVIKGKSELYDYLLANDRHVFLNGDDPIQKDKLSGYIKKIGFSQEDKDFYQIKSLGANPFVKLAFENLEINTQLTGAYNFPNCAIAVLIGKYFNVPHEEIQEALESYVPDNNRSQILKHQEHTILLDAYNANPTSMEAALESFAKMQATEKIVFLGDMFELGEDALKEHQYIAQVAKRLNFKNVYLVGEHFNSVTTDYKTFPSFEALKNSIELSTMKPATILIKGSRGMAMERLLKLL